MTVDLEKARALVRELSDTLGAAAPEPLLRIDTEYEVSDEPGRPGTWQIDVMSNGERRRTFLPSMSRGTVADEIVERNE